MRLSAIASALLPDGLRRRVALGWAAATLAALLGLSAVPGVSREEAAAMAAGSRDAAAWRDPGAPRPAGARAPALSDGVAAAAHGALAPIAGDARAWRAVTALLGAFLSSVLALLGWELAGLGGALLAPALFWLVPRHLHHALAATPALAAAALWTATALAWRRALSAGSRLSRGRWTATAALLYGLAGAVRPDGWALLAVLAIHALVVRRTAPRDGPAPRGDRVLLAMLVAGPLVAIAASPALWRDPLALVAAAWPRGAALDPGPLVAMALAVPVALLVAYAGGLLHGLLRLGRALRAREPAGDEALLVLLAVAPLALSLLAPGAAAEGLAPLLPAMPPLALLAARALDACARTLLPARAGRALAAIAVVVLYPALRASIHHFPHGAAAWNELAGGAPGAAARGLPRQAGGEAAAAALPEIAAHARPGARIWWAGVAPEAVGVYARDGRLRGDLALASSPEDADLVVATLDGGPRDAEYAGWSALRTARPVAAVYVDEVPLVFVYARAGGWR